MKFKISNFNQGHRIALDLFVPFTVLNYHMVKEYPLFADTFLDSLKLNEANLKEYMELQSYDREKTIQMIEYKKKFWTNSQYWH